MLMTSIIPFLLIITRPATFVIPVKGHNFLNIFFLPLWGIYYRVTLCLSVPQKIFSWSLPNCAVNRRGHLMSCACISFYICIISFHCKSWSLAQHYIIPLYFPYMVKFSIHSMQYPTGTHADWKSDFLIIFMNAKWQMA